MKSRLFVLFCVLCSGFLFAQNKEVALSFVNEEQVLLNGKEINKNTSIATINAILGEPVVYKKYMSGKTIYHYVDLGIAVNTYEDKLAFIGANYNWDGDKTFPNTTYTGTLSIDGIAFDKTSTEAALEKIENLEFLIIMKGFYISKPKTATKKNMIAIGFKDEVVTQIGVEFH